LCTRVCLFVCLFVCFLPMCLYAWIPLEVRRGHWVPRICSCKWMWTTIGWELDRVLYNWSWYSYPLSQWFVYLKFIFSWIFQTRYVLYIYFNVSNCVFFSQSSLPPS